MKSKIYTGIGSRNIPEDMYIKLQQISYSLASKGYTLRSGKAGGSDEAFQKGVQQFTRKHSNSSHLAEIYIPWKNFNNPVLSNEWDKVPSSMDLCEDIACKFHPAWDRCSQGAKKLHSRNVCQVLGDSLDKPSDFVLYYAREDSSGNVKGGTATSVKIARYYNIPTINIMKNSWRESLIELLEE